MFDPKASAVAIFNFLFQDPQPEKPMPLIFFPERRSLLVDPLDVSLGLGKGLRARLEFQGAIAIPRDMTPRLVKRQQRVRV